MSLAILFHFWCTQHVSDTNTSIIRSLRLCCWITTLVVLFSVRCVLEIWCGWVWVVSVLQVSKPSNRHKDTPSCLANSWQCTYSEMHRVSLKTKYEVQAKVLDGVFYETLKRIKQKHGQSLKLLAILFRQTDRLYTNRRNAGELNDLPGTAWPLRMRPIRCPKRR